MLLQLAAVHSGMMALIEMVTSDKETLNHPKASIFGHVPAPISSTFVMRLQGGAGDCNVVSKSPDRKAIAR